MTKMHNILFAWTEPEYGNCLIQAELNEAEQHEFADCVDWFEEMCGDDYGHTFPRVIVLQDDIPPLSEVPFYTGMSSLAPELAFKMRYTDESLYDQDNPILTKYLVYRYQAVP